jgi:hypothetical protein
MNDTADSTKEWLFAIDLTVFRKAHQGGLNQSVCYLVLARGTGKDNSKSSWSINAIERYTGISGVLAWAW